MNGSQKKEQFLGVGWGFPVCDSGGTIDLAAFDQDIRESIRIILGTNPGERIMRPDFGAGLRAFVFRPVNPTTLESLRVRVEGALVDWEPRIDVIEVRVTSDAADRARVVIDVRYRVRSTNSEANLVYPFYLEEGAAQ